MQDEQRTTEVRQTDEQVGDTRVQRETTQATTTVSGMVMLQRVIWFITGVILIIIALRFVLLLLGANRDAGFTDFIYNLSGVFVSPFVGIFGEPTYGSSVFEIASLLAIVVFALVGWGIGKLLTISRPQVER